MRPKIDIAFCSASKMVRMDLEHVATERVNSHMWSAGERPLSKKRRCTDPRTVVVTLVATRVARVVTALWSCCFPHLSLE